MEDLHLKLSGMLNVAILIQLLIERNTLYATGAADPLGAKIQ